MSDLELLDVGQAAEILHIAKSTLYKLCAARRGPAFVRVTGRAMFRPRDLEAFIASRVVNPLSNPQTKWEERKERRAREAVAAAS